MISEKLGLLFSHLKKDDVKFFKENWSIVTPDIEENFLSYCIEEKAYKVFQLAIDKGLIKLRSIIVSNALRENNLKVLSLIVNNNLFSYNSQKATDLLSISVNNNDLKVIDILIDKVKISPDILNYAIRSQNIDLIDKFVSKGFLWDYIYPEDNPIVFVMMNYKIKQKEAIDLIIKDNNSEKMKSEALLYFEDTPEYQKLLEYLK